ncbi:hypothetical protein CDD82_5111 [Ophiocordyceps australis]|uniref:Palmitoyltransferase n=1 Tax=Ophiocordyceps australis TaxID=1399860 RepID=A0A2C5Z4H9_9HYPO|nr:hypothetical protein CDD82_5111 [Ophiocordyceps australis]
MALVKRVGLRWLIRLLPVFILAVYGVGIYAVVYHLCLNYIGRVLGKHGLAAALMTLFLVLLVLSLSSYLRTFVTIQRDPGLVPLVANAAPQHEKTTASDSWSCRPQQDDVEACPRPPCHADVNSPGLEAFYSKDVFVCESDGRPRWCSLCHQWKPDRAHHASELGRCVRKMDHVCPWVGGVVSETSFNFFFHFTFYTTCLCSISIAAGAYSLHRQVLSASSIDAWAIVIIGIASLFGLFTLVMCLTATRFLFTNTTNIDVLRPKQVFSLAIRVPLDTQPSTSFATITYPLTHASSFQPRLPPPALLSIVKYPPPERHLHPAGPPPPLPTSSDRDRLAVRKFAIVRTEPRENPWALGFWANFKSVMGNNVLEWILPIRHSPCCNHDSMVSDYTFGPLLATLKKRCNIPDFNAGDAATCPPGLEE